VSLLHNLTSGLRALFRKQQVEQEMDEELRGYLDAAVKEKMRSGMSYEQALRAARVEMGSLDVVKEEIRSAGWESGVETLWQDVRYGLRQLGRNPGFTVVAVLTLALGIGANTAIFSVVNAVVLRPLPYPRSDRLMWIAESIPLLEAKVVEGRDYVDWNEQSQTLDQIAACGASDFNFAGRGVPAHVRGAFVSASFFAMLGTEPNLGRGFTAEEDKPGGAKVAILMHSFWQQYFGSDPHVLGQTATLDATPYTIIGVMPAGFRVPGDSEVQVLVPLALTDSGGRIQLQGLAGFFGRLKPGVSVARAQNELDAIRKRAEHADQGIELKVVPLAEHLAGNLRPAMLVFLGVVGLDLLIACANVANLMLTRASARTREMAVRAALGASRWRLIRQLLAESATLALAGGVAGLLLAAWVVNVMTRFIPATIGGGIVSVTRPHVDGTVLLFALAISVVTGILFGLAPALAAARPDLVEALKEGAQVASAGRGRGWLRGALGVAELSLALVLLIGAGLLIKSLYRLLSVDPGFVADNVLTANISLTDSRYPTPQQKTAFFSELLRRVQALPGVRSAALGDSLPLSPYSVRMAVRPDLVAPTARIPNLSAIMMPQYAVSPGYFYTLGIPLLRGRAFTDHDDERVAVVNEFLASRLWPGEDPVGKQLALFQDQLTVVGVAGNTLHEGLNQTIEAEIYVPYLQENRPSMQLAVRTAVDPGSMVPAIRARVKAIDPNQPIYNVATLQQILSDSVTPQRLNVLLLGIFAFIALGLATVGIYGVMAFSVTQRTNEIGIRMAFGADKGDVLRLVVGQGLRLTAAGVVIGLAGAWALTRFLTSFLFGVRPTDIATYVVVSLALASVSLLACYIPARRATKVDPMVALRYE
jgi:putative ABC transport system permease protein